MKMGINDFSADDVISKMDENNSQKYSKFLVTKNIQKNCKRNSKEEKRKNY